jgi:2-amino-4-hydroxy-6-hydroxymethyldihydropteridine diphosphokinase
MGGGTATRPLRYAGCLGPEVKPRPGNPSEQVGKPVIVALGSNLGDSAQLVFEGMRRLESSADGPLLRSSLWQTAPVDCPPDSPPFINAVVAFNPRPGETPDSLLARLQELEREFGRRPKRVLNEPRALDLDLIAFGEEVRATSQLTLPHPRACTRRFVLQPLSEIAPDRILPGHQKSVAQLLDALPLAPDCRIKPAQ